MSYVQIPIYGYILISFILLRKQMGITNKFHSNLKENESSEINPIKISIQGRFSASENESGSEKMYNMKHLNLTLFKEFTYLVLIGVILVFSNS